MSTLKNLVNKGVKVELGLPYELWDEPSVEVSDMKKQVVCAKVYANRVSFMVSLCFFCHICLHALKYCLCLCVCVCVCDYFSASQCETMLEQFEEVVEDWYFHHQEERLERFLCESYVLDDSEQGDTHTHTHTHIHTHTNILQPSLGGSIQYILLPHPCTCTLTE